MSTDTLEREEACPVDDTIGLICITQQMWTYPEFAHYIKICTITADRWAKGKRCAGECRHPICIPCYAKAVVEGYAL